MNLSSEEIRSRIATDPDFVNIKRFDYSLEKVLDRYPDGAPIKVIAQALHITTQEVEETLEKVISKLRQKMKVEAI